LLTLIIAAAAVILVIVLAMNIRAVVAPLEGIGHRIIGRQPTEGTFPVRLPGNADVIHPFGDSQGFMLLSSTYVYTYSADGGRRSARRHGYPHPQSVTGGDRVLVYDHNGRRFSVFNTQGLIFENDSSGGEQIVYAVLGNDSNAAIVYRSEVHTNILSIYGSNGEWRFTKRFTGENVMQAAFTANDADIIVTTVSVESGSLSASVRRFDTSSTSEEGVWNTTLTTAEVGASLLPVALHVIGDSVFVLCDSVLFVLDLSSGNTVGSYRFTGTIIDCAFSDTHVVIIADDFTAGRVNMIVLDNLASFVSLREVAAGASQAEFVGDSGVALLTPGSIAIFSISRQTGQVTHENDFPLKEDFTGFVVLGGEILLLGYNTVERLELDS
jgi:hypothetical protein